MSTRLTFRFFRSVPLVAGLTGLLLAPRCQAQQSPARVSTPAAVAPVTDTVYFDLSRDLGDQLVSFDSLYQLALITSPTLRFEDARLTAQDAEYRASKVVILQSVSPFGSYSQGTQAITAVGISPTDAFQLTNGYRFGVNVQLPVGELLGHRQRIRQTRALRDAAQAQRDAAAQTLRLELIRLYQNLLASQRILRARLRDEQTSLEALRATEEESQLGKITPALLAQVSSLYANTKAFTEQERNNFQTFFYQLETLVGRPLNRLMRRP
jgi:outer membrane protein TolC